MYSVNLATGANTLLGNSGTFLTGLAFNAAQTTLYSVDQGSGNLFSINTLNGTPTLIGATGVTSMLDLATNAAGTLYGVDITGKIYTINTGSGLATLVGQSLNQGITSIEFSASGDLYGISINSDALFRGLLTTPVQVGALNPSWNDVRGLLFVDDAAPGGVPEPATWAMMLLGFGAVGVMLRRRHGHALRVRFA